MNLPVVDVSTGADGVAFYVDGNPVRRHELVRQALSLAAVLQGRGRFVINLASCRYQFTRGFAGALVAGQVNLLPANRQPQTIAGVVDRYPDCLVLHDDELQPELSEELQRRGVTALDLRQQAAIDVGASEVEPVIPSQQLAAIVFTSGSTGEPAAIAKPWRTLTGTAGLLRSRFIAQGPASIVATVPPQHMYGLETTVLMSLFGGCAVAAGQPFYPADIVAALAEVSAPRVLVTTPVHMKSLLQSDLPLPSLDMVISATAPLDAAMALAAEEQWACRVMEIYGCSEAGSLASRRTATDSEWHMLEGMTLAAAGDELLQVQADHLSDPVVLQDRLELVTADSFRLLGRGADMLNIAGKRASIAQLTAQLQGIEGVSDAVYFLREESRRDIQRLAALVVTERGQREIMQALAGLVDPAFMPRPLKKVSVIPRNAVGKIPREELLRALGASSTSES